MLKRNVIVIGVLALGFVLGDGTLAFTQDKKQGAPPLRQQAEGELKQAVEYAKATAAPVAPATPAPKP